MFLYIPLLVDVYVRLKILFYHCIKCYLSKQLFLNFSAILTYSKFEVFTVMKVGDRIAQWYSSGLWAG
jgi:hypothetical protein